MRSFSLLGTTVIIGAAFVSTATQGIAALVTETPVAFGPSTFPEMLNLPEFNSSLGELTGISIVVTTTTTLEADVANFGPATIFTGATATGTTTLNGLPGLTYSETLSSTPFGGIIGDGSTSPARVYGQSVSSTTSSPTISIPSADFGAYVFSGAPNSTQNLLFDANFLASFSGSGPAASSDGLFFGGEANASGMVDVTYTYTPTAVPECGSLCAGLGALLCFGLTLRNRLSYVRL